MLQVCKILFYEVYKVHQPKNLLSVLEVINLQGLEKNELKEDRRTQLSIKIMKQLKRREGNYFLRAGRLLREILHHVGAFSLTISALYHYQSRQMLKLSGDLN